MAQQAFSVLAHNAAEGGVRLAQAITSLQETVIESRRITARSRALRETGQTSARSCACGSTDVYTTLVTSMASYRRCRACGNIWAVDAVGRPDE